MLEDQAWLGGSVGYAESVLERARFNFQNVVKVIYKPEGDVKPEFKPKEYKVGETPEIIELNSVNENQFTVFFGLAFYRNE